MCSIVVMLSPSHPAGVISTCVAWTALCSRYCLGQGLSLATEQLCFSIGVWLASLPRGSCEFGQGLSPSLVGLYLAHLCSASLSLCCSQRRLCSYAKWAPEWKLGKHCPIECLAHSGFLVSDVHSFVNNLESLSCLGLQNFLEPSAEETE